MIMVMVTLREQRGPKIWSRNENSLLSASSLSEFAILTKLASPHWAAMTTTTAPQPLTPAVTPPPRDFLLWIVAIGFFMETLDSTIVNTALPSMAQTLGESPLMMHSVVIAYSLTLAMFIPASGWIADRFGTRNIFCVAITLFACGSALCASSRTLPMLVGSRFLQGLGGAMLMPVGRLAVLHAFPGDRFLKAISFVAVPALIGPLLGPTLGGWLVEVASWHWIFLINIPIGIVGFIATWTHMPNMKGDDIARFDLKGFFLLSSSMAAISFALDGLSELGLGFGAVVVLLMLGMASLAAYWLHASRHRTPLFSLRLFKTHSYAVGLIGNLFARIGSGAMPFLIPLLLQVCLGYTPMHSGLMMVPTAVTGILARRWGPPLILRAGYRRFLLVNTVLVGLTMASFALLSEAEPIAITILQLAVFGAVNSLQFMAMNTLTLKDLETKLTSSGNSLFSMVQMLSMSLGVASAGALLATFAKTLGAGTVVGGPQILPAFHTTFLCMGLVTSVSAFVFWQLTPGRSNR